MMMMKKKTLTQSYSNKTSMTHEDIVEEIFEIYKQVDDEYNEFLISSEKARQKAKDKTSALLTTYRAQVLEEERAKLLPYLKGYLNTLDCDWGVNPVQTTNAIYTAPERVLRDQADAIERKRETANVLRTVIEEYTTN